VLCDSLKASHTRYRALGPELIPVYRQSACSHSPGGRLPLLCARPAVTSPAAEHHRPLADTKLYCLVSEAHRCKQLAQGCYAALPRAGFEPATDWSQAQMPYPLHHLLWLPKFCNQCVQLQGLLGAWFRWKEVDSAAAVGLCYTHNAPARCLLGFLIRKVMQKHWIGEVGKQSIVWFHTFSVTLLPKIVVIGLCMSKL